MAKNESYPGAPQVVSRQAITRDGAPAERVMFADGSGYVAYRRLLTPADVAAKLGITAVRVRQLAAAGTLPGTRWRGRWEFRPDDVRKFARIVRRPGRRPKLEEENPPTRRSGDAGRAS